MVAMITDSTTPPYRVDARRPILSVNRNAGIEVMNIKMAETPDARNEASDEDSPAC